MRRATTALIFVLFLTPGAAAGAQQVGRCYPPPCAVEEPAPTGPANVSPPAAAASAGAEDVRSPAPFVATGLLAVLGSLSIVALRRRSHIQRRADGPLLASAAPSVGGAASPEPQPALR